MNKTKRKIFETSMKLFSEKGYEATSVEEITAVVGIAKGTLYHHFSSKEEIFNYLIDEGMKLLQNSVEIKIAKLDKVTDKLRAVVLIQTKVLFKYNNLISIVSSEIWGNSTRNLKCQKSVMDYISFVEKIAQQGIDNNEFPNKNARLIACNIFSIFCSAQIYQMMSNNNFDVIYFYKEFEKVLLSSLFNERKVDKNGKN